MWRPCSYRMQVVKDFVADAGRWTVEKIGDEKEAEMEGGREYLRVAGL